MLPGVGDDLVYDQSWSDFFCVAGLYGPPLNSCRSFLTNRLLDAHPGNTHSKVQGMLDDKDYSIISKAAPGFERPQREALVFVP